MSRFSSSSLPAAQISGRSGGKSASYPTTHIAPDTVRSSGSVRLLCLLSAGPIEGLVEGGASIFLDDIPVKAEDVPAFEDVSWHFSNGTPDSDSANFPGFNHTASEVAIGRRLVPNLPIELSHPSADAARLSLRFPAGLVHRTAHVIGPETVRLKIELEDIHRRQWDEVYNKAITEKQTRAFEMQILAHLPAAKNSPAPRRLRITRLSPEAEDSAISDLLVLSSVSWIFWDHLTYGGLATLALSVGAEPFDGRLPALSLDVKGRIVKIPENYNAGTRAYNGLWSGRFIPGWTDNPAWVLLDILTDNLWGLGLPPGQIDRYDLYEIARYCDEGVEDNTGLKKPRFTFNAVLNRRVGAARMIADICAAIRVIYFWSGDRLRFVQDRVRAPRLLVANSSVLGGQFVYHGAASNQQYSHALATYLDRDGKPALASAIDTDCLAKCGYRALEVFLTGCSDPHQAQRHANWLLASQKAARQAVSYQASLDHFADNPVRPGDVILIEDSQRSPRPGAIQARLERAAFTGFLDSLTVPRAIKRAAYNKAGNRRAAMTAYIIRLEPDQMQLAGRYMGRPPGQPDSLPEITRAKFYYDQTHSTPEQNIFILWFAALADGYIPAEGSPICLYPAESSNTDAAPEPPFLWRITDIRQKGAGEVEVTALACPGDEGKQTEEGASASPQISSQISIAASQFLPDRRLAPARAILVKTRQFESYAQGYLVHEIAISWEVEGRSETQFWQVEYRQAGQPPQTRYSQQPHIILSQMHTGTWQLVLRAIDWLGRKGMPTRHEFTVLADSAELPLPDAPVLRAIPGGAVASWHAPDIGAIAFYEIWEMDSRNQPLYRLATSPAAPASLSGLSPRLYSIALRYQRQTGKLSSFGAAAQVTPLALASGTDGRDGTDGTDGRDGTDGLDGNDGNDGKDGTDGTDGTDGLAGTQTLSMDILGDKWSDEAANSHIRHVARRAPISGDILTMRFQLPPASPPDRTGNFAETRIFGTQGWQLASASVSGSQLIQGSVSAQALYLDGVSLRANRQGALAVNAISANQITSGQFTSTGYKPGQHGFLIDTSGSAEFNHVSMRGTLDSSLVRTSILVTPLITTPTQAGPRFLTARDARPVRERWKTHQGNIVYLNDLLIAPDNLSDYYQDEDKYVLAAGDSHGDIRQPDEQLVNRYIHRFRRLAPKMVIEASYTAPDGQTPPRGTHLVMVRVAVKIKAGTQLLADSGILPLSYGLANSRLGNLDHEQTGPADGFDGLLKTRNIRQSEPAVINRNMTNLGYTKSLFVQVECFPFLKIRPSLKNQKLSVEVHYHLTKRGSFKVNPLTSLIETTKLKMDTLS